jgi:hypothetical protein
MHGPLNVKFSCVTVLNLKSTVTCKMQGGGERKNEKNSISSLAYRTLTQESYYNHSLLQYKYGIKL